MGFDTDEGCYTYHYELKDWDLFQCKELDKGKPWDGHTSKDVRRLLSIPATDITPVVRGQWIEYQIPHVICCSNCDWATDAAEKNFLYCPMCGARMEEVSE